MTAQTPPTDRPLTAGDWIEWHGGENPVPGTWAEVRHRGHIMGFKEGWGTADNMRWSHNGSNEDIIAYRLSRPATSAASEGEGQELLVQLDDYFDRYIGATRGEDMSLEEMLISKSRTLLAALASPPVSERERELEGLFAALRENSWDLRCISLPTGGDDCDIGWRVVGHWQAEPRERAIAEVFHDDPAAAVRAALTAQPAGEPTHG